MDDRSQNKRKLLIAVTSVDIFISGFVLLTCLGFFPIDLSWMGLPVTTIGIIAGIWFVSALAALVYFLTRTDPAV